MTKLTRKQVLKDQQNLTREEKKKIGQKYYTEADPSIKHSVGSFILDDNAIPQQLEHALGTIDINGEEVRYYGLKIYQNLVKFNNKTKQEYTIKQQVPCILTEKGEIYGEHEKPENTNFVFCSELGIKENRLTLEAVRQFTKGNYPEVTYSQVFEGFKEQYEKNMVFERPEWYDLNALWDLATYFQDIIDRFLIIKHEGASGTAKSKAMKISAQLSFNGKTFLCPTPANFFRYRSNNKAMLCIEEAERLFDDSKRKQVGDSELVEYLNGSYEKGNTVPRQNDKNLNQTDEFDPAGFTRIGAINPLHGALEKRSVTLTMIKAKGNDPRGETEVTINPKTPEFQELRNNAYVLGLTKYRAYKEAIKNATTKYRLTNRQWLISKPLIALAGTISKELQDTIGNFLYDLFSIRDVTVNEDSWNMLLANVLLKRCVVREETVFIDNKELVSLLRTEIYDVTGEEYTKLSSHKVTKLLDELSLKETKSKNSTGDKRGINLSFFRLAELLIRNEKKNLQEILKKVSEVSERPISDDKIRSWYTDTFTDTLENNKEVSEDLQTNGQTGHFSGGTPNFSEHLLSLVRAYKKPLEIEILRKQKQDGFDFEEWLKEQLKNGILYEPKHGFVGVLE